MKKLFVVLIAVLCLCMMPSFASADTPAAQTLPDEAELAAKADEVLDYLGICGAGDYDKIYGVYDYICQNVEYDWAVAEVGGTWDGVSIGKGQTAYEALCQGKAVCAGISRAIELLLDELNVSCKTVVGLEPYGMPHAWNLVKLNGVWYFMDATADLGQSGYSSFLMGSDDFSEYQPTDDLSGYNISSSAYGGSVSSEWETWGGYSFNKGTGDITIYSYTGSEANLVVPSKINGRPVKRVAEHFLYDNDSVKTLTFSEGIEKINSLFAYGCDQLKSISIPSTAMLAGADGVNMVTGLGGFVYHCDAVETVTVASGNPYLCVVDNVLYNKEKTSMLYYPPQSRTAVVHVPDGVQKISDDAFARNQYIQEVILPDSVTRIGYWAFDNCSSLKKVNIPGNCEFVGQYAFQGTKLTEMHIPAATWLMLPNFPETLERITVDADHPDYYCKDGVLFARNGTLIRYPAKKMDITYVVPEGVTTIGWAAFDKATNLTQVILPESLTRIEHNAFSFCTGLTEITIPERVEVIDDAAFAICEGLKKIELPDSLKRIGYNAFGDCWQLMEITLPTSLTEIGSLAFQYTGLQELRIPASVTSIEGALFQTGAGIVLVVEPDSAAHEYAVEGGYAFRLADQGLNVSGTYGDNIEWSLSEEGVLLLTGSGDMMNSDGSVDNKPSWALYERSIREVIISEGITSVGDYAFAYYGNLTSITLPSSLRSIGYNSFASNDLKNVVIPEGVTYIDTSFRNNTGLASITIPESVTWISYWAFEKCKNLVIYCHSGSYAERYAISYGIKYEAEVIDNLITIPASVTTIESEAFSSIAAKYVYIHDGVESIAADAFDEGVIIVTPAGSYAQKWAQANGFICFAE